MSEEYRPEVQILSKPANDRDWVAITQYSLLCPVLFELHTKVTLVLARVPHDRGAIHQAVNRWSEAAVQYAHFLDRMLRRLCEIDAPSGVEKSDAEDITSASGHSAPNGESSGSA